MSDEQHNLAPIDEDGFNREEVNAGLIGGLTAVTVIVIAVFIIFIQFYYDRNYEQQVYVKVLEPVSPALQDLRAREDEQLGSYKYIDRDKGTVNLPIRRAMELLAAEYAAGAVKYPTAPYAVQPEEEAATGGTTAAE